VTGRLDRYFGALVGFGGAAMWSTVGTVPALSCIAAAGVSFCVVLLVQRRSLARMREVLKERPRVEPETRRVDRSKHRSEGSHRQSHGVAARPLPPRESVLVRERVGGEAVEVVEYGW
jgi:hypothetical protein